MASATYVKNKHKAAADVGIISLDYRLSKDSEEAELLKLIRSLNSDDKVHGILVQPSTSKPHQCIQSDRLY